MSAHGSAQAPAGNAHTSVLGAQSIDRLDNGDLVVTFTAGGDLRGLVTLTIHPAGSTTSGEWAFAVAHAETTDPATGIDPELAEGAHDDDADHPHKGFLRLVQQGSLSGAITGASVSFDADGVLTDLAATLTIDQGAQEFDGATGSGQSTLTGLTLNF